MLSFLKKIIICVFVLVFWPIFFVLLLINNKNIKQNRILVINNAKIGDLVCATPVFREIKEKYKNSYLCVLVTNKTKDILINNKNIDKIIPYALNNDFQIIPFIKLLLLIRKEKFNICINMIPGTINLILPFFCSIPLRITAFVREYGFFYKFLTFLLTNKQKEFINNTYSIKNNLSLLEFIEIYSSNYKKEVYLDGESDNLVNDFFYLNKINEKDVLVGISLSAGNKIKQWDVGKFFELSRLIIDKYNYKIIILGSRADKVLFEEFQEYNKNFEDDSVVFCDNFSLKELPSIINKLNYFISVDTGPIYISNALGIPVLDIAGPCSICDQIPIGDKCEVVYNDKLNCWPCSNVLFPAEKCRIGNKKCLNDIGPKIVLESFDLLVKNYGK